MAKLGIWSRHLSLIWDDPTLGLGPVEQTHACVQCSRGAARNTKTKPSLLSLSAANTVPPALPGAPLSAIEIERFRVHWTWASGIRNGSSLLLMK